jgi:hypothetical protein
MIFRIQVRITWITGTVIAKFINITVQRNFKYFLESWKFLFDYSNLIDSFLKQ